ncbi:CinA family protein [Candidatus Nanopelagicales bacterium]|nr:CinA family protein [Candidatus Nanopelagicales bacterium]
MTPGELAGLVLAEAQARHWTIAVAESLTGGEVLAALTAVPGASSVVRGGAVAYQNSVKTAVLGVSATALSTSGAVSQVVVSQMARGVAAVCAADIGLATTGVAGPGPEGGVAAGSYWVGIWRAGSHREALERVVGDRASVRQAAVLDGLTMLAVELELL